MDENLKYKPIPKSELYENLSYHENIDVFYDHLCYFVPIICIILSVC